MVNAVKVSSVPFTNWCGWYLWIYLDIRGLWIYLDILGAGNGWADVAKQFILSEWRIARQRELDHLAGVGRRTSNQM